MTDSYYTVLECDYDSPLEEIKKKYQELVLRYHPDKNISDGVSNHEKFHLINEAWKVLREPESRHRYNAELKHMQTINQPLIYATLHTDQLKCIDGVYTYSCRCSGLYTIPVSELLSPESLVECDECSFSILIKS